MSYLLWQNSWMKRPSVWIIYWWCLRWANPLALFVLFSQNEELINFWIHYSCSVMRKLVFFFFFPLVWPFIHTAICSGPRKQNVSSEQQERSRRAQTSLDGFTRSSNKNQCRAVIMENTLTQGHIKTRSAQLVEIWLKSQYANHRSTHFWIKVKYEPEWRLFPSTQC